MSNITPWLSGNVKPVRKGMYQRRTDFNGRIVWSKWDGEFWRTYDYDFYLAQQFGNASFFQNWKWRGLAQDPSKGGAA